MVIAIAPPALLLATSTTDQLVRSLFDDTFNGIHHLEFFDWAMLIPYFAILVVLSFYGCHRYEMIRNYLKHRRDAGRPSRPSAGPSFRASPSSFRFITSATWWSG